MVTSGTKSEKYAINLFKIYFLILVFEGAFRKWYGGYGTDIWYFARDLLAILSLGFLALYNRRFRLVVPIPVYIYVFCILIMTAVSGIWANISPEVLLVGLRNYYAPVLVIFFVALIGSVSKCKNALIPLVSYSLYLNTAIAWLQSRSSRDSWINGGGSEQFQAMGLSGQTVRASGTFSSALGFSVFVLFCFVLLSSEHDNIIKRSRSGFMYYFRLVLIFINVWIAGSRTLLIAVLVIFLFKVIYEKIIQYRLESKHPRTSYTLSYLVLVAVSFLIVIKFGEESLRAFETRIRYQTEGAKGTLLRIWTATTGHISELFALSSLFGNGVGTSSNAARALGQGTEFVDYENMRLVRELGVVGFLIALVRQIWFLFLFFGRQYGGRLNVLNPSKLWIVTGLLMFTFIGTITQPTIQGFAGLCLSFALLRDTKTRIRNIL